MTTLLVGAALLLGGLPQPNPKPDEGYKPEHDFCNTRECDQRANHRAQKRKVQKRHKAAVRRAAHARKMLRVIQPVRGWLASTRSCESGGNYSTNTGNGFYGAYQFVPSTWWSVGGKGMPHLASKLEQDYRAALLYRREGSGPWPVCG